MFTVWIIGYAGSGKSTTGKLLRTRLSSMGVNAPFFDAEDTRRNLFPELGFDDCASKLRGERMAWLAWHLNKANVPAIVALTSPSCKYRSWVRRVINTTRCQFIEVFLNVSFSEARRRARRRERNDDAPYGGLHYVYDKPSAVNVVGIHRKFEAPSNPEVRCAERDTGDACVDRIITFLISKNLLNHRDRSSSVQLK